MLSRGIRVVAQLMVRVREWVEGMFWAVAMARVIMRSHAGLIIRH